MKQTIGSRIKQLREQINMSQDELAGLIDIDRVILSNIENDKRRLKAEELSSISNALRVTTDQLLGNEPLPVVTLQSARKNPKKPPEIRINVPKKNIEKFKEVLLYILAEIGAKPNIGETVIYKLLYFIDFNYYEKYEEQLIGATYIKNNFGPTPVEFHKIMEEMIKEEEIEQHKSKYFKREQKKYIPLRQPDLSCLNAQEVKVIDEVLDRLSDMNASSISEYSHKDVPWIVTEDKQPIDYETVFYRTPSYSVRKEDDINNH